jgi:hypothetical protein
MSIRILGVKNFIFLNTVESLLSLPFCHVWSMSSKGSPFCWANNLFDESRNKPAKPKIASVFFIFFGKRKGDGTPLLIYGKEGLREIAAWHMDTHP